MTTSTPTASALVAGDPAADALRAQRLRRMRVVATSLLVVAAVVYAATIGQDGVLGFVNAAAEASMVGAIADWFAVTALFRHPLGIPVPHTALIPRRKDELGRGLQEFVGENFLQEQVLRERTGAATIALRLGTWASVEANARWVVDEASTIVSAALGRVRDEHIEAFITDVLTPQFREEPIAPLLGGLLEATLRDGVHHGLVDLALTEIHDWLVEHPDTVAEVLEERAPWWTPARVNDAVIGRVHVEMVRWVADIRDDPEHRAREALDELLAKLANDLQHDPETQERAEQLKLRLLDQPQIIRTAVSLWEALQRTLTASLADPEGAVRRRALTELTALARRLVQDAALQRRLDGLVADAVVWGVARYGDELTSVITTTIARWDGDEAARRIELHVGRDLQFIRINGTVVGGLVGLLIHALTVLLG